MLCWIENECSELIVNTLVECGRQAILSWCEGAHHLNTSYKAGWFFQSFQFWLAHVSCSLSFLLLAVYWLIIFYTKLCSWCVVHQIQTELIFFLNGTISNSNISYVVCIQLWVKCVVYGIFISLNSFLMYTLHNNPTCGEIIVYFINFNIYHENKSGLRLKTVNH